MNPRPHLFGVLAGLFLAAGLAGSAAIVASTLTRLSETNVISVTGSARRHVRSDLVVWRANFSVEAPTLLEAQQRLQADLSQVAAFLQAHGLGDIAAAQGGRDLDGLRAAKVGVVQINPLHSTATSWEGNNDTTAVEKTITATVSATFALR